MTDLDGTAVRLEDVSFRYRSSDRFTSFKEYAIRRLERRVRTSEVWAVRGVSADVSRGEVFGIVGRNAAGKSSLLRLVAGILRPTSGRVRVRGWPTTTLLDVGAGFHPDLTGRENVYLNATLLGRTKRAVDERLDDILAFAELGDAIEAPLRTYSSGMSLRLGFAVATAWEPGVLLVDEVLAVGDEAFRRKCEERIAGFRARGATVLLVSHDLGQVRAICDRALWLDDGRIRAMGDANAVVEEYLTESRAT